MAEQRDVQALAARLTQFKRSEWIQRPDEPIYDDETGEHIGTLGGGRARRVPRPEEWNELLDLADGLVLEHTRQEAERDALMRMLESSPEEPANEAFLYFQRLHGLPEIGGPTARLEKAEATLREWAAAPDGIYTGAQLREAFSAALSPPPVAPDESRE